MVNKSSRNVVDLFHKSGVMGVVLDTLNNFETSRTKKNYQRIKEKFFLFPLGIVHIDVLQRHLEEILDEEEMILVLFRKKKKNGKTGHKKEFQKGFYYYIGRNTENLLKVYIHWKEEKRFIIQNIASLESKTFDIQWSIVGCVSNACYLSIQMFNPENKEILEGEISLYIGYNQQ